MTDRQTTGTPIQEARERHALIEVAQRAGIALDRTHGSTTARCPFPSHGHPDRTPSLRLYLDQGRYYCFGCGAKGDVIQWVRDAEGLGVSEAIRVLDSGRTIANRWARLPYQSPAGNWLDPSEIRQTVGQGELPNLARTNSDRVRAALEASWKYYTFRPLHTRGIAYLAGRGIEVTILEAHTGRAEVGHTPSKPDGLVTALRAQGFNDDELVDAGLAYRRLGGDHLNDFYRHRVLIPVRDAQGRICGLIGRNVRDPRWPKYKNPPQTHAYDKSINLYQPLPAPADPHGQVVVVEGTLDALAVAIAAVQAGASSRFCPVTQSGRELSDMQLRAIVALHQAAPVLGFDADAAGTDSAFRYSLAFAAHGKAVMVAILDEGHDPASWLATHGPRGLAAWARHYGSWTGPAPTPAATFLGSHLVGQSVSRTAGMEALIEAASVAGRLSRRDASGWVQRLATVAGATAVAEAQDRQASSGHGGAELLLERIAEWGKRVPRSGDSAFIRSATLAIGNSRILPAATARVHLERALGRVMASPDDARSVSAIGTEHLVQS